MYHLWGWSLFSKSSISRCLFYCSCFCFFAYLGLGSEIWLRHNRLIRTWHDFLQATWRRHDFLQTTWTWHNFLRTTWTRPDFLLTTWTWHDFFTGNLNTTQFLQVSVKKKKKIQVNLVSTWNWPAQKTGQVNVNPHDTKLTRFTILYFYF